MYNQIYINIAVTNHGVTREDGVVSRDCVHEINIIREDTLFVSFIFLYLYLSYAANVVLGGIPQYFLFFHLNILK